MNRYYVFTSAKENQVSIHWKDRVKTKNWENYPKAIQKLQNLPTKALALRASLTIKLTRKGGWEK